MNTDSGAGGVVESGRDTINTPFAVQLCMFCTSEICTKIVIN